jgi:protein-S-isoprenylcysteine O-methyltransferase Ste14
MTNEIHIGPALVAAGLCLIGLGVRTGYELLKKRGLLDPRNKAIFAGVFAAMSLMLGSWPVMALLVPSPVVFPWLLRWIGFGSVAAGLLLAVGGVAQLRGLENIDHLVTTGLYARLRHPMYTGFILWIVGWALTAGAVVSFAIGAVCIANVLYWRWLEEDALRSHYGERYRVYCAQTWF